MKIFVAGGGSVKGLAVNNKTRTETFMKMDHDVERKMLREEEPE